MNYYIVCNARYAQCTLTLMVLFKPKLIQTSISPCRQNQSPCVQSIINISMQGQGLIAN